MTDQPTTKRKLELWWTCGLPGCSDPTRAGATFHGMLMERGFAQIIMRPVLLGFTELQSHSKARRLGS